MQKVPRVLLLLESSRASGRALLRGIANYARHHGSWVFYWQPHGLEHGWPQLDTMDAQGVILRDVDKVKEVVARKLPAVVVGHQLAEVAGLINVVTDSAKVSQLAADHLLECGLRHFAFCGYPDKLWSQARGEHFERYLSERGHRVFFYPEREASHLTWKQERQLMARWLKSLPMPVGLLACNDDRAVDVIEVCKMTGLHLPDQVALVGVDNDDLVCELSDPPLSSVVLNFERAGYESAQALDQLMRGKKVKSNKIIVHATHLVPRQSTNVLAIQDPAVAKAVQFIRSHVRNNPCVNDVVRVAGVSRRLLEYRFRTVLGHTILQEIHRVRADQIARMLIETNLTVGEIASTLNYSSIQHVARFFRKVMNLTPLAYRKLHGKK